MGQCANFDRMQRANLKGAGAASTGGKAGVGTFDEDREFS